MKAHSLEKEPILAQACRIIQHDDQASVMMTFPVVIISADVQGGHGATPAMELRNLSTRTMHLLEVDGYTGLHDTSPS